jgi:hypothetical protein
MIGYGPLALNVAVSLAIAGPQLARRLIGALGDQGIAAQRDQLLDAVPACVPDLDPKFQGIDRAHADMEA